MKKTLKYLYLVGVFTFVIGCTDTPAPDDYRPTGEPHYLEVSQTEISFGSDAESKDVSVHSSQNWAFSDYASWLSLSQESGEGDFNVSISAEENFSADVTRTSVFYLKTMDESWNFTKTMSANQKAAVPYIIFSPESIITSGSSSTHRINISANTVWTARCDADWLTFSPADDLSYIDINISENLTNEERTANLIVSGAITETFTITQNIANLDTETNKLEYSQSGGSYLLKINSEVAWSARTSYDWIDVAPVSGTAGEANITISTTPNWDTEQRYGTVGFYVGDAGFATVLILQEGVKLSAPKEVSFRALGESKTVQVEGNLSWNVLSKPSWVTISPDGADGSSMITITAENNSDATNRTGVIKLGKEGVTHTAKISVSQDGKYFSVNNE